MKNILASILFLFSTICLAQAPEVVKNSRQGGVIQFRTNPSGTVVTQGTIRADGTLSFTSGMSRATLTGGNATPFGTAGGFDKVRNFANITENVGSDINVNGDTTSGHYFYIFTSGLYFISYSDRSTSGNDLGITKNYNSTPSNCAAANPERLLCGAVNNSGSAFASVSCVAYLVSGDSIRAVSDAAGTFATDNRVQFRIVKIY